MVKKILKVIAWMVVSIVALLVVAVLLIQIPAVQSRLTQKAVAFLEGKIGTDVSLGAIRIGFPKRVVLEGIYVEDQSGDTLLYAGRLSLNTDLWALTKNKILLNEIALEDVVASVSRPANDSAFNYSYILDAFAGDSTAVPDTLEQKGWDFSIGALKLKNIRVQYHDLLAGNIANATLGNFELGMDAFDLETGRVAIGEIRLTDTRAYFEQTQTAAPAEEENTAVNDSTEALIFSLDRLTLERVNLDYRQASAGLAVQAKIGELDLKPDQIDLDNKHITLQSFTLDGSSLAYIQDSTQAPSAHTTQHPEKPPTQDTDASPSWHIALNDLRLTDNELRYDDYAAQPEPANGAVDFSHLHLDTLNVHAQNLTFAGEHMGITLQHLSFKEQSGLAVSNMQAVIAVNETSTHVRDFLLTTDNSRFEAELEATYSSLSSLGDTWPDAAIHANINHTRIGIRDLLYLQPSVTDSLPVALPRNAVIQVDASMNGTGNNLRIPHLTLSTLSHTALATSATLVGLADPQTMRIDVSVGHLTTSKHDMERLLPDGILPDSIELPQWLKLTGHYAGTLKSAKFTSLLTSDVGSIHLNGNMDLDSTSRQRGFNAVLEIAALDVGHILGKPDSVIGSLTMHLEAHSRGLSLEEMDATLVGKIEHFQFQNYNYENLRVQGRVQNKLATLVANMDDPNLSFDLDAGYLFSSDVPRYQLTLNVKNADFKALHFSSGPITGRGTLVVDLATADFRKLNGSVGIRKFAVFDGDQRYAIDSLLFASIDQEGKSEINIDSDLLTANFEGSINLFSLPQVVKEYINSYYHIDDSLETTNDIRQHFTFNVDLKKTDILTGLLIPNLTAFVPGEISGEFDSERKILNVHIDMEDIQYSNIGIRSFTFETNSDAQALHYNLAVDRILIDSVAIDGLTLKGTVADDALHTALTILDSANVDKYLLAGTLHRRDEGFEWRFLSDGILLNYEPWRIPDDHFMQFGDKSFVAQNVTLTHNREKIIIDASPEPRTPVHIGFRALNLEYLTSMVAIERPLSGLLEGDIRLYTDTASLAFTSNIGIKNLHVRDTAWGNLSLQVEKTAGAQFDVDFSLRGHGNDVGVKGFYTAGEKPAMNLTAAIHQFRLASLQPLLATQLQNLKGMLVGNIRVSGTPSAPHLNGGIAFKDTEFFSTYLSTAFTVDDESISFTDRGVTFNAFEIADRNQNKARINGSILTQDYRNFRFNLDLITDRFRLLDTHKGDNDLFYGLVDLEATATIRGDMATPVIDMVIGLSDDSNLTYVVPQSESAVLKSEGIVKFVDKTFQDDPFMRKTEQEAADTVKSSFTGIDLTARIELTDQERLTIVIDPLTGDQLSIRGNSTLTFNIDPTGDMHLTGRYEIEEGTYNLSFYKFVKREFQIDQGSSITWTGDPLNAEMDIRAIYEVETSPIELFSSQLPPGETTRYKERLPFMVYLNIEGELLQPEISFELAMPMEERNVLGGTVYARLQDINTRESDLNKQVFALLILKRFIADNPFENSAGGGFESTARRSVSKVLSEQLNRLSENIKGVELSFDIKSYEDYSSGAEQGRTDLELGFSKSLLNDRLVVKLSGNINLEGDTRQQATDYIGDLALEYKLTPDGRFRITGFRNSDYDMIDGELTETGAGLIYVKDYNALRELFKANAETKN